MTDPTAEEKTAENGVWELAEKIWTEHESSLSDVLARAPRPDPTTVSRLRRMFRRDDQAAA